MFVRHWKVFMVTAMLNTVVGVVAQITHPDTCLQSNDTVSRVDKCPSTQDDWDRAALVKNCSSIMQNCTSRDKFAYHCLFDDNNNLIEVCGPEISVLGHVCVEYYSKYAVIQRSTVKCSNCTELYNSTKSFLYQECYNNTLQDSNKTSQEEQSSKSANKANTTLVLAISVIILVTVLAVASIFIFKYCRLKQVIKSTKNDDEVDSRMDFSTGSPQAYSLQQKTKYHSDDEETGAMMAAKDEDKTDLFVFSKWFLGESQDFQNDTENKSALQRSIKGYLEQLNKC